MGNEFTALWSGTVHGTSRTAPTCLGLTVKADSVKNAWASLREAIALILEHRREESLLALPQDARQELVVIG